MNANAVIQSLPPLKEHVDLIVNDQDTGDIITDMLKRHGQYVDDYDGIEHLFPDKRLLKSLFDFVRKEIPYEAEPKKVQTTRSPAAIMLLTKTDCKHYAQFIAGVLDAKNRKFGDIEYDWFYRFVSYDPMNPAPTHVFTVVNNEGSEIWIDPTLPKFNTRNPYPSYFVDYEKVIL